MLELSSTLHMKTRPPPPEVLAQAFNDFFRARQNSSNPLEELHVSHATNTFEYLQKDYRGVEDFGLSDDDLRVALIALVYMPKDRKYETHKKLARLLFEEYMQRRGSYLVPQWKEVFKYLRPFITILSRGGDSLKARETLERYQDNGLRKREKSVWNEVLRGFAKEKNDEELLHTLDIMQKRKIPFDPIIHEIFMEYYASKDDVAMAKKWYQHPIEGGEPPTIHTDSSVLKLCIRCQELGWGEEIVKSMLARSPDKRAWNTVFLWAAAKGKGVDEIERMMQVMVRRNEEIGNNERPDIGTINSLVELANVNNDPYTAERYVALGQKWSLQPNAHTYLLQLEYRIRVGDLDGARSAYSKLQSEEIPADLDIPLINKLILALCNAKRQDYDAIMSLVEDLSERKGRFEPETVSALSLLHLQREEIHELVDLLHTHTFHYGLEQRSAIRDVFVNFCLDRSNTTSRAWDSYCIIREIFAETEVDTRTRLMREFFERKRSDMASHVFGHMRQYPTKRQRPRLETYAACFEGIGKAADAESLEMVHNMLKLDSEIEPNTRLYNALMLAYTGCGMADRSLDFWGHIVHSREGPSYNSIQIALMACEALPFGDRRAREIWARLQKFGIEVTREIYTAYIGALAGQMSFTEGSDLVEKAESETGFPPDIIM